MQLSPMTKATIPRGKKTTHTQPPPATSITYRSQTNLGLSVGVEAVTQWVWLNLFMGSQPSPKPQKM